MLTSLMCWEEIESFKESLEKDGDGNDNDNNDVTEDDHNDDV